MYVAAVQVSQAVVASYSLGQVQVKVEKFAAHARTADARERAALWPLMVKIYGPCEHYQTILTDRIR